MGNPLVNAGTSGASSPISIPLSSGPAVSSAAPVITTMFGALQVGGKGNSATESIPTPGNIFGGADGGILSPSFLLPIALGGLAVWLLLNKR